MNSLATTPEPQILAPAAPRATWSFAFLAMVAYLLFEYARLTELFPELRFIEPAKVLIAVALIGVALLEPKDRSTPTARLVYKALIAFTAIALMSAVFATFGDPAFTTLTAILNFTLVAILIGKTVTSVGRLRVFSFLLAALMLRLAQHQVRYYRENVDFGRSDSFMARGIGVGSNSFFGNSNDFGLAMATFFPLMALLAFSEKNLFLRIFYTVTALVVGAAMFLSGSRGSMFATAIVACLFLIRSRRKWVGVLVLTVVMVGASFLLNEGHWERIRSAAHFEEDGNAQMRLTLWSAGIDMFVHHPVLGVGPGNFAPTFGKQYATGFHGGWAPHSIYIQPLAELGLPGLGALSVVLIGSMRVLSQVKKRVPATTNSFVPGLAEGLFLAVVAFMINGATITVLYYPHIWFLVGMSLGLSQAASQIPETAHPPAASVTDSEFAV